MKLRRLCRRLANGLGYTVFETRGMPNGIDHCEDIKKYGGTEPMEVIFDVGAHEGRMSALYHGTFTQAHILAFEPIPATFETLAKNLHGLKRTACHNLAFGQREVAVKVFPQKHSVLNSLVQSINRPAVGAAAAETVQVISVDRFTAANRIQRIDLLKTDTEGYDLEVMKGASRCMSENRIRFVFAEVNFNRNNPRQPHFMDMSAYLEPFGFELIGLYDFHASRIPDPLSYCNALFYNSSRL